MTRGYMCLVAVLRWHIRKDLSFSVSNTLNTAFCVEALNEALDRYSSPQKSNADQGAQFTSNDFTSHSQLLMFANIT